MTRSMRRMQSQQSRSRRLNLEALEPRICLATYTTVDLFPLPGDDSASALGLNDNGLVVGKSGSPMEPVVWSVSPTGQVAVASLPGVDGGTAVGLAYEVNNLGMIAGDSVVTIDGSTYGHAVVWTGTFGSYTARDLGTLPGFTGSEASSISEPDSLENVWVVGQANFNGSDGNVYRAMLWQVDANGTVLSIDLEPSSSVARANDVKVIGDSVFVAGHADDQAVIWEVGLDGVVVGSNVLGTAEYYAIRANALNSNGDVAGWGWEVGTVGRDGFLYESDSGVITGLGTLGETESEAYGINDNNVTVGTGWTDLDYRAFVWEDGTMHTLQDLVSDNTFLKLVEAKDVNNRGEIVGIGGIGKKNHPVTMHGFLARPEGGPQAPVAFDDSFTTQTETTLTVAAPGVLGNDTDADGDALTAILQSDVSGGTLTFHSDGSFVYIPNAGTTSDSFTYRANDGTADSQLATVTILVQEAPTGELTINDVQKNEGRNKTTKFTFTVSLSESLPTPVTVQYATEDGSATAGTDYVAATGTLIFAPGETTKTLDVLVNGDRTAEPDEIFYVNLSGASGATIVDGQGLGTIVNDDGAALLADFGGQTGAAGITLEQVQHITPMALAMWGGQAQVALANGIQIQLDDLPPGQLGLALGNTITLDIDANGAGWYADLGTPSAGRVDLLTVVSHEIGHLLGYDHSDMAGDLMSATLPVGTRRLPGSTPLITYDVPGSAVVWPQHLPEHQLNVMQCDLADPLLPSDRDRDTRADSDVWMLPLIPRDYVAQPQQSSEAAQVRILKAIADEEIELLDDGLLDLLAAGQE